MVRVEGGRFKMGCTAEQGSDCWSREKPAHRVELSSFSIGKYEVTQAQWEAVMGSNPSGFSSCGSCPVENVSWNDVQDFIVKLNRMTGGNYRLPTEAEWEYAARGATAAVVINIRAATIWAVWAGIETIAIKKRTRWEKKHQMSWACTI